MTEASEDDQAFQAPALNPDRGESIPKVRYASTPEDNWTLAERAYERKDWLAAQQYYSFVRAKFPYSRYAAEADVRIADCQFQRQHYVEAVDSYQNFIRLRPTHPLVPYAMFKTGMAHVEEIPGSWFLIPPPHEKDQTAVKDAAAALSEYLNRFPGHENYEEAQKAYEKIRERLVRHERAVADFYRRTGHYRSYAMRLQTIRTQFGQVALTPELLLEIARAHARLGDVERTEAALDELQAEFPEAPGLERRSELIEQAELEAERRAENEAREQAKQEAKRAKEEADRARREAKRAERKQKKEDGARTQDDAEPEAGEKVESP